MGGSGDSPSALFWDEDAEEVGELAWGVVDGHDGAAVVDLIGAHARHGEQVREDLRLRGEEAGVDTERGVAVGDEDKVAVVQPEFGMEFDTSKGPGPI